MRRKKSIWLNCIFIVVVYPGITIKTTTVAESWHPHIEYVSIRFFK
jgi:hypothetical protein